MTPQGKESARESIEGTGLLINKAADAISSVFTKSDSKPGTLGKPDHQETVKEEGQRVNGQTEVPIPTREERRMAGGQMRSEQTRKPVLRRSFRSTGRRLRATFQNERGPRLRIPKRNGRETNDGAGSFVETATEEGEPITMGKQTQLHLRPEDMEAFLGFVRKRDSVVVTLKSSDSSKVTPVAEASTESEVMTFWNKTLLASLERKLIRRPGGSDYYRVDDSLPTLEFSPSRLIEWNGKPALLQGRVYGFFDKPTSGYEEWYKDITQWIRHNCTKSPLKLLGGYVGPAALRWFQDRGILLPMIEPPSTPEWLSVVAKQHASGSSTPS